MDSTGKMGNLSYFLTSELSWAGGLGTKSAGFDVDSAAESAAGSNSDMG